MPNLITLLLIAPSRQVQPKSLYSKQARAVNSGRSRPPVLAVTTSKLQHDLACRQVNSSLHPDTDDAPPFCSNTGECSDCSYGLRVMSKFHNLEVHVHKDHGLYILRSDFITSGACISLQCCEVRAFKYDHTISQEYKNNKLWECLKSANFR